MAALLLRAGTAAATGRRDHGCRDAGRTRPDAIRDRWTCRRRAAVLSFEESELAQVAAAAPMDAAARGPRGLRR